MNRTATRRARRARGTSDSPAPPGVAGPTAPTTGTASSGTEPQARWSRGWEWFQGDARSPWTAGRIVGEVLAFALVLLLAFTVQVLNTGLDVRTAATVAFLPLLWALRRPLPGTTLLVTTLVLNVLPGFGLLLPVVGWSVGKRTVRPSRALSVLGLAFVIDLAAVVLHSFVEGDGVRSLTGVLLSTMWFLALVAVPGLTARYLRQRQSLVASVRAQHRQLLRENAIIARETRMRERQRIARDMHDSLGHQLTLIAVHTGALQVDPELSGRQREAVGVLREASVTAMRELREVVGLLKEDDGQEPTPESAHGVHDIAELVSASRRAGASAELTTSGKARELAPAANQAAYRIVQEGLTNAHKHAPGAPVTVALRYEPDVLLVEVVNGRPPPLETNGGIDSTVELGQVSGGRGLHGLGERARAAGGLLHSGSYAEGFRLTGTLPYDASGLDANRHDQVVADLDRVINSRVRGCLPTVLIVGGVAVVLLFFVITAALAELGRSTISPSTYESVQVGQSEAEVREKLPEGTVFGSLLDAEQPPRPRGSSCLVTLATSPVLDEEGEVVRFCFLEGKLVEKRAFD